MSSRQLRKLQKQRELAKLQDASPAENTKDSEESEDEIPIRKPKPSLFAGFAALDSQRDEDDEDSDDNEGQPNNALAHPAQTEARTGTPGSSSKKSKKKKKKAKKTESSLKSPKADTPANDADEIEKALEELKLSAKNQGSAKGMQTDDARIAAYERICELLRINTQHLKVMNEMRNLFGREAIAAAEQEENEERARTPRHRNMNQQVDLETFLKGRPGKSLPEVTLRRNPFLMGKETWPRAPTEGLTMRQFKEGEGMNLDHAGVVEFGFAHDVQYNQHEQEFFRTIQMHNPMLLVYFLHEAPYHISTLIQVSKVAKQDQNSALSADLCERALFTFGRVSLSSFRQKMEEGKARLDFRRPENRQFWLAGYHYLKNLIQKGTFRTALEWAKLLFSMDLNDPYGMIHFIHPLAIRAHESRWFIDFCDSEVLDGFDTVQDYIRQTLILARLQLKDTAGAKALLLEGMEKLPWLYSSIYKSLNLDVPRAIWGTQARDSHEELFVQLYIHQTKSLWDNAQALSLLKEVASEAKKSDLQTFGFPPIVGRNVARFVYLDNTPALMSFVPDGLLDTSPNWEFDPIPPLKDDNIFSYESQKDPWLLSQPSSIHTMDIPRDAAALHDLLNRARRANAPPEIERFLQEAIAEAGLEEDGGNPDENDNESQEEDAAGAGGTDRPGVVRALLEWLRDGLPGRGGNEGGGNNGGDGDDVHVGYFEDNFQGSDYSWEDSDFEGRMPGAWGSDSDSAVYERIDSVRCLSYK
ncbi:hypothetical protein F5Y17DRAFT_425700 [Xylariaceae sp. FL0594]|nr:hypothetical protein F5Y17DRAFT_425700 [Xylariaceae sp. FL0594]